MTELLTTQESYALELLQEFHRAQQVIKTVGTEALRSRGITNSQFHVLSVLHRQGPQTVQGIIDHIYATSGNMTVVIRNMESAGLVERLPNPADRRSFLISLTDKGEAQFEEVVPEFSESAVATFDKLTEEEQAQLYALLNKLKATD